jgi:hypothetical protein
MLSGFLADFGQKIAERWASLLVLPGLVFTAAATAAVALGQSSWWDVPLLWRKLATFAAGPGAQQSGAVRTAVLLLGVLAVSLAAALVAAGLGELYARLLAGRWPWPLRWLLAGRLTQRRVRAWERRERDRRQAWEDWQLSADAAGADAAETRIAELEALRNDVALMRPACPTWTGDRLRALTERVRGQYRIDLADAWPRLWLLLPDSTRQPLTESRARLDEAARLGGWAVLYVILGAVWWPSALGGACAGLLAWRWTRERTADYTDLVEAVVDVYIDDLLDRFDDATRPARPSNGPRVTERFRKGAGARHH